ncbi:hypothetical protein XCR_1032 [Xanthomonas campestris pv. raphani 756C]|nr:hypothetical protein XCR_1032 [Xanthomonas campestris pv. raphani 756C]
MLGSWRQSAISVWEAQAVISGQQAKSSRQLVAIRNSDQ